MIVSASTRTDVPAFYGDWFMARLAAGHCRVANPYGGPPYEVRLDTESAAGFVFWTKNIGPFAGNLARMHEDGRVFIVQYTINNFPRALETSVLSSIAAIRHMHDLARRYGTRAQVWRYDPIVVTSLTPLDWHVENFTKLAEDLAGATDEVVISFAHVYRKTRRNLDAAATRHHFDWRDPEDGEKRDATARLAEIASDFGMRISLCSQPDYLVPGVIPAKCVDAARLSDVAGHDIAAREKGNRPGCACADSRDIGAHDTCPHGCVYCYAVATHDRASARFKAHDPAGEMLVGEKSARS